MTLPLRLGFLVSLPRSMTTLEPAKFIIVMDDEAVIRGLTAKTLRRKGYQVSEAPGGAEAVELLRALVEKEGTVPCLMILDLLIPGGMGGQEALGEARKLHPDVKALIASGYSDEGVLEALREEGRTEILAKPYTMGDLLSFVEKMF